MTAGRDPSTEAELRKLAHSLGVTEAELWMLTEVPGSDLRALRTQLGQALFDADKHHFTRIAALAKAVPTAVAAKLTEVAVPPLIAARTAELLEAKKGADLVARLSPRYLADVASAMDVARSPHLIDAVGPEQVAAVGGELARREEWVVMGGFVSFVTDEGLARTVAGLDGGQLLHVAYVLDDLSRLDHIAGLLTDRQRDELLTAAPEQAAWEELTALVRRLGDTQRTRLAQRLAAQPAATRQLYEAAVADDRLDAETLAAVTC